MSEPAYIVLRRIQREGRPARKSTGCRKPVSVKAEQQTVIKLEAAT